MVEVSEFIQAISNEKEGFNIGEAWRITDDSLGVIVPVTRKTDLVRDYIILAEAQDVKIEDSGRIDHVYVKNNEDKPLLISRGEIFKGKTQERAAVHGYLIEAGKGADVAVRCIHQSKGIQYKAEMSYGGRTPYVINLSDQRSAWDTVSTYSNTVYPSETAATRINPHTRRPILFNTAYVTGQSINDSCKGIAPSRGVMRNGNIIRNMSDTTKGIDEDDDEVYELTMPESNLHISGHDDLVGTLGGLVEAMKVAMQKIPNIENQVGAIFINDNQVIGLDVYDLDTSWAAIKRDIIEKEGASFMKKSDNLFEFKPERIKEFITSRLGSQFEEKVIYEGKNGYKVIEVKEQVIDDRSKRLLGEAVTYNDRVIHLTMYRG